MIRFFRLSALLFFVSGCAQVVAPEGGPKDEQPPRIVRAVPDNQAVNYTRSSVTLTFDEFINVKEPGKILVSPYTGKAPKVAVEGRSVRVDFDTALAPNTTYLIDFGKSIVDVNEGNILDSTIFAFSTGPELDTLRITGTVKDAITGSGSAEAYVFLYTNLSDSAPLKAFPQHLTRTDADGRFLLNNIKPGIYRAFSLKDLDNDYQYDHPAEPIAFFPEPLVISRDTFLHFSMFAPRAEGQSLMSARSYEFGSVSLVFNLPPDSLVLTPLAPVAATPWYHADTTAGTDSVVIFFPGAAQTDTASFIVNAKGMASDTVITKFESREKKTTSKKGVRGGAGGFRLVVSSSADTLSPLAVGAPLRLIANHPLDFFSDSLVLLTQAGTPVSFSSAISGAARREVHLKFNTLEDSSYILRILPGAVTDIFKLTNDSMLFAFTVRGADHFGNLSIKAPASITGQHVMVLMAPGGKEAARRVVKAGEIVSFKSLSPGAYGLFLIEDRNGNGRWDTGDYFRKTQPEKIISYPGRVTIRSNWDQELEWDAEPKNRK